mmetsp:Transcript_26776/g.60507  ORF Transcript_26776/g.60507 Transcript_26776/m.60507 type:complete len:219 (-) Transcript_26776:64-720(-)
MRSSVLFAVTLAQATAFAPPSSERVSTALRFFGAKKAAGAKSSPLAEEAVGIYNAKFAPRGGEKKKLFFESWGMPESYSNREVSEKSIFTREDAQLRATFNTIAALYGEEEALAMVKILPQALAFNKDYMAPSLDGFSDAFGLEESKEMVMRNPGLLGVEPKDAVTVTSSTMQLSYIVSFTRPLGNAGLAGIGSLLLVPVIEGTLGLQRGELIGSLLN